MEPTHPLLKPVLGVAVLAAAAAAGGVGFGGGGSFGMPIRSRMGSGVDGEGWENSGTPIAAEREEVGLYTLNAFHPLL